MVPVVQVEMNSSGTSIVRILDYLLHLIEQAVHYEYILASRVLILVIKLATSLKTLTLNIWPSGYLSSIFCIDT